MLYARMMAVAAVIFGTGTTPAKKNRRGSRKQHHLGRKACVEVLERRELLSANVVSCGVSETLLDTDQNWKITPGDVLGRVNWLNANGAGPDDLYSHPTTWLDSWGKGGSGKPDGFVTPGDVLDVIRNLNLYGAHEINPTCGLTVNGSYNDLGQSYVQPGNKAPVVSTVLWTPGVDTFMSSLAVEQTQGDPAAVQEYRLTVDGDGDGRWDAEFTSWDGNFVTENEWLAPNGAANVEVVVVTSPDARAGEIAFEFGEVKLTSYPGYDVQMEFVNSNPTSVTILPLQEGAVVLASVEPYGPIGDTVGKGTNVKQLAVSLVNIGSEVAIVDTVTVHHTGMGSTDDIQYVYVEQNDRRVSRPRTFEPDTQVATLRLDDPIYMEPGMHGAFTISVSYSVYAVTGSEHAIQVELSSDLGGIIDSVVGVFPLDGDTFHIAAVQSGLVTVNQVSVPETIVQVGDRVVVAQLQVAADLTEDQTFYQFQFDVTGPLGDLGNFAIQRMDGTYLTPYAEQWLDGSVVLSLDQPMTLLEGDRMTLQATADVLRGEGDAFSVGVEYGSDVFAVGNLYGNGVNGQSYGSPVLVTGVPTVISIGQPRLVVVERSGPSEDTAVENEKNVVVERIEARSTGTPLFMTELIVAAGEGNLINGQNYSWWVDTNWPEEDGFGVVDTVLQRGAYARNGEVVLNNPLGGGYVVGNWGVAMEVRMDVASSLAGDTLRTVLTAVGVERVDNGAPADWEIHHNVQTLWHLTDSGTLTFEGESHRPKDMVQAGERATFFAGSFTAVDEPIEIPRIPFSIGGYSAFTDFGVFLNDVRIEGVTFGGSEIQLPWGSFVVPEGGQTRLVVSALLDQNQSGTWYQATVDRSRLTGIGWISSNLISGGDGLITGPLVQVTKVAPADIRNAGPATAAMPTGIAEIGRFEIVVTGVSDAHVVPDQMTFDVTAVNVGMTADFILSNRLDPPGTGVHVTGTQTAGGYRVTFTGLAESDLLIGIPGGESATFVVWGNITNPNTAAATGGRSSLQTAMDLTDGFFEWYDDTDESVIYDWVDLPMTQVVGTANLG